MLSLLRQADLLRTAPFMVHVGSSVGLELRSWWTRELIAISACDSTCELKTSTFKL